MDYAKIYYDFYTKYFDKAELLIKHFFVKRKSRNRTYGDTLNSIRLYLSNDFKGTFEIEKNQILKELHILFNKRYNFYEANEEQEIFTNELKEAFDKIDFSKLPKDYNFIKLIKSIAIIEVVNEISRLLSNNSRLFEMMYQLNEFDDFEIRYHRGLLLDHTPIFKKLHKKAYPDYYIEDTGLSIISEENNSINLNIVLSLFKSEAVYHCFKEYQKHIIDFYTDYSYLKKRLEQEKLIYYHKDNDFMKIIFSDLNLITEITSIVFIQN